MNNGYFFSPYDVESIIAAKTKNRFPVLIHTPKPVITS